MGILRKQWICSESLKNSKHELYIKVFSILIDGLCRVSRSEEAREIFDEILKAGLAPDVVRHIT